MTSSKPENGIAEDGVDAGGRVAADRVLGHGQHDDRDPEARLAELRDDLLALRPALEEPVDDDDVGAQLARPGRRRGRRR